MCKVKTPWEVLSNYLLFGFGVPFLCIGILFHILSDRIGFLLNGILWMALGLAGKMKGYYDHNRQENLRQSGICYTGTVISIHPSHFVRIGSYITARVVCTYNGETGSACIKSHYFLLSPFDKKEDYQVKVYVQQGNSTRYMIELYRRND